MIKLPNVKEIESNLLASTMIDHNDQAIAISYSLMFQIYNYGNCKALNDCKLGLKALKMIDENVLEFLCIDWSRKDQKWSLLTKDLAEKRIETGIALNKSSFDEFMLKLEKHLQDVEENADPIVEETESEKAKRVKAKKVIACQNKMIKESREIWSESLLTLTNKDWIKIQTLVNQANDQRNERAEKLTTLTTEIKTNKASVKTLETDLSKAKEVNNNDNLEIASLSEKLANTSAKAEQNKVKKLIAEHSEKALASKQIVDDLIVDLETSKQALQDNESEFAKLH